MKITVIGAGNVGATSAQRIVDKNLLTRLFLLTSLKECLKEKLLIYRNLRLLKEQILK